MEQKRKDRHKNYYKSLKRKKLAKVLDYHYSQDSLNFYSKLSFSCTCNLCKNSKNTDLYQKKVRDLLILEKKSYPEKIRFI